MNAERRPRGGEDGARSGWEATDHDTPNRPRGVVDGRTRPALAERVDGVLVVVVTDPRGHDRRRTYLTLAAAQRAVVRARERGAPVAVMLARLVAVGDVTAQLEAGAA